MATRQSRTSAQKQHQVTMQPDSSSESGEMLSPDELARALRAMAAELERDPALARRVAGAMRAPLFGGDPPLSEPEASDGAAGDAPAQPIRRGGKAFKPKLVTGAAPALGPGVPDPFALREQLGRGWLARRVGGFAAGHAARHRARASARSHGATGWPERRCEISRADSAGHETGKARLNVGAPGA